MDSINDMLMILTSLSKVIFQRIVCEHFKDKSLVSPEIQNGFNNRLFQIKQISYSEIFWTFRSGKCYSFSLFGF